MELVMVGDVRGPASASLDPARAEAVYQEGRAMELDDAVSYALGKSEASQVSQMPTIPRDTGSNER